MSLKDEYNKILADCITVSVEDLNDNEVKLIDKSFDLFQSKLDDIKILQDENTRLSIELANTKAMLEDIDEPYMDGRCCSTCGRGHDDE